MNYHVGDKLTLTVTNHNNHTYKHVYMINKVDGHFLTTHIEDGSKTNIVLDSHQVNKRMGISWKHETTHTIQDEELFTL